MFSGDVEITDSPKFETWWVDDEEISVVRIPVANVKAEMFEVGAKPSGGFTGKKPTFVVG